MCVPDFFPIANLGNMIENALREEARDKITQFILSAAVETAGDATAGAAVNDNLSSEAE